MNLLHSFNELQKELGRPFCGIERHHEAPNHGIGEGAWLRRVITTSGDKGHVDIPITKESPMETIRKHIWRMGEVQYGNRTGVRRRVRCVSHGQPFSLCAGTLRSCCGPVDPCWGKI